MMDLVLISNLFCTMCAFAKLEQSCTKMVQKAKLKDFIVSFVAYSSKMKSSCIVPIFDLKVFTPATASRKVLNKMEAAQLDIANKKWQSKILQ